MKILLYSDLDGGKIPGFDKFCAAMESDNFTQADVHKIGHNLYRARLNRNDRLLFSLHSYQGNCYCLVLEYIPNHAYEKSRFLNRGVTIDETKIEVVGGLDAVQPQALVYLNTASERFNLLDKIISFDNEQQSVYDLPPPLVVIGSAGSGKTALTLEKMKQAIGDVLYVSLSSFLVQNAQSLYYANNYGNEDQELEFLSYREFLESIRVPRGREISLRDFDSWFQRHKAGTGLKDSHTLFEEFRGVLTGPVMERPWLDRDTYLALGVKQSIFTEEVRPQVYDLFVKYRQYLEQSDLFDPNIISHQYTALVEPRYDFIVVDEVQDLTNIQLYLILKSLRQGGNFILCGDSNQIVHPNFFSWSKVKTLFFENRELTDHGELIRVLHTNYRNSPTITQVANTILKLKHARFGSIDKESNYLVNSVGEQAGTLQLLEDSDKIKHDLDAKTARSTHFAVLVMHSHQKEEARRWFNTPLVFSIQEAKGLEYKSIILFNFISGEEKSFREIAAGVDSAALNKDELVYSRARDKRDKSLEVYKFFINALYVAITRAVKNLYLIENNLRHPVIELLQLARFSGDLALEKQDSSLEEWQKEARRLELQGKQEQAEEIRNRILQQKPVPWPVLTRENFLVLQARALRNNNKKDCLKALEYALIYQHMPTLNALIKAGFKPALQSEEKALPQLNRNHYVNYDLNNPTAVLRDTEKYGVDHRTVFNLTPLMVAARLGNAALVEQLLERGADPALVGSNGLNAVQITLERAVYDSKYGGNKAAAIYALLDRNDLTIQVQGRLVKLDRRLMGLFILNLMFAMFYRFLGVAGARGEGFTAKDIAAAVKPLPEAILPEKRKRQAYISSILSGNEVSRDFKYNRKLFVRLQRGHYIINPGLKLRLGDDWVAVHDLLNLDDLDCVPVERNWNAETLAQYRRMGWMDRIEQWNQVSRSNLERFRQSIRRRISVESETVAQVMASDERQPETV